MSALTVLLGIGGLLTVFALTAIGLCRIAGLTKPPAQAARPQPEPGPAPVPGHPNPQEGAPHSPGRPAPAPGHRRGNHMVTGTCGCIYTWTRATGWLHDSACPPHLDWDRLEREMRQQ